MKIASALALFLLFSPATAQDPAAKPVKKTFVLEAGEVMLPDFIDRCATHLGWNVLSNINEISGGSAGGATRLQHRIETDATGCEELLGTMLYRNGFALTTLDGARQLYEVIAMNGPRSREVMTRAQTRTVEQVLLRPGLKVAVLVVVELKHINATIATNALRPFFASTGSPSSGSLTIGNVGTNSALVLCGVQEQVAAAIRLLQICDVPAPAGAGTPTDERIEALESRIAALEKKLAAQQTPQGR